jgi:hypothetical protein
VGGYIFRTVTLRPLGGVTENRFSSTTAPQLGLLLWHDENKGISRVMVNGLVPI